MKRALALATILALAFTPLAAQDFQKGLAAFEAGDYATALSEWKPLAEARDASAQYNLGSMFELGQGVPQDDLQAVKWYRRAADQGDAGAQKNLGLMYYFGQGVPQDDLQAVKWYRRSADQGYAYAQFFLGLMFELGQGVPQDNVMSHMWYNIASTNGDVEAGERRDKRANLMTTADITRAQSMASDCTSSGYTKCGP